MIYQTNLARPAYENICNLSNYDRYETWTLRQHVGVSIPALKILYTIFLVYACLKQFFEFWVVHLECSNVLMVIEGVVANYKTCTSWNGRIF